VPAAASGPARHVAAFRVAYHEVGPDGAVGPVVLANWLQQAAGEHAAALGLSAHDLAKTGVSWVLSRQLIEIARLPGANEPIAVETWAAGFDRSVYRRDFRVTDGEGRPVAVATSAWVTFDLANRRAIPPVDSLTARVPWLDERAAAFARRTVPALRDATVERRLTARLSDLDMNGHVNNANLFGWFLEALPQDASYARLTEIDAIFRAECHRGDVVVSRAAPDTDGWRHSLDRDGTEVARAATVWAER